MQKAYGTTRIWNITLRKLRLIASVSKISVVTLLERLTNDEWKRLGLDQRFPDIEQIVAQHSTQPPA